MSRGRFVAVAGLLLLASRGSAAGYVWWEAERPEKTNFPSADPSFGAATFEAKRDLLSGRDWLANSGTRKGDEAFAAYRIDVTDPGAHALWCRKFWKHGPFRWRVDEGPWTVCPFDVSLADNVDIRQYLGANWVHLGTVDLAPGEHAFELRLLAKEGEELTSAFDCFLLIKGPFIPRGRLKPDEKSGKADAGRFAWEPEPDAFRKSDLDLRRLNEAEAGEHGWIGRRGAGFVRGDGRPVRFWGVNAGGEIVGLDHASLDALARRLAKAGVNLVRSLDGLWVKGHPETVDPVKLDHLFYFISALKKQGIYFHVSCWWPLFLEASDAMGLEGYDAAKNKYPFALLFFNPRLQELHRGWLRTLLTSRNPYTGLTLARDPALALLELQNEDGLFFWTFSKANIPPPQWRLLETRYGAWLVKRYGSIEKARLDWIEAREADDSPAEGRMALYEAWRLTRDGLKSAGPGLRKRVSDQVRFLAELQRGGYA
ncbi:MAG: hypothetical protein AAB368_05650, partial [bacterium]